MNNIFLLLLLSGRLRHEREIDPILLLSLLGNQCTGSVPAPPITCGPAPVPCCYPQSCLPSSCPTPPPTPPTPPAPPTQGTPPACGCGGNQGLQMLLILSLFSGGMFGKSFRPGFSQEVRKKEERADHDK